MSSAESGESGGARDDASDLGALLALEREQKVSDPVAQEGCFELVGSLGEVGPAFEMQRDHRPGSEDLGDIGGVVGGQGQVGAVEFRELDRAGVQDRDWELTGPLHYCAHDIARGVIARDVDPVGACGR
jgi:hypothetical protein